MTNNFTYFEDAVVSKEKGLYKVELQNLEGTFFLRENIVDKISVKTNTNEELIAILLANMDCVRISRAKNNQRVPDSLPDDDLIEVITCLLTEINIEELISYIKEMKWHQICHVFRANSPIKEIREII